MRKCYIEENGIKYEETHGGEITGPYAIPTTYNYCMNKYPYVLKSEEGGRPELIRLINNKLYYLISSREVSPPIHDRKIEPVYKDTQCKRRIGVAAIDTEGRPPIYKCLWIPLTLDMLHKDNNNDTTGKTD